MQTIPQATTTGYEFRFITVLANHANAQSGSGSNEDDLQELLNLGRQGWQVRGMAPDPLLPAAKLVLVLQREIQG
jgi:hypothetical protein